MTKNKLQRNFFNQATLKVAQNLLGKTIVFNNKTGIIYETEAYIGQNDPACHAAKGMTPRNKIMFGPAGIAYVYFIYGMYFCLNFVTEKEGFPAAVLIRGIKTENIVENKTNGPGKLCNYFGITKKENGVDICNSTNFYVANSNNNYQFICTPRIGIKNGTDKLWRFKIKNSDKFLTN